MNFCQLVNPSYEPAWFHEKIAEILERALKNTLEKKKTRIILSIPPRHGKLVSDKTRVLTPSGWKSHGDLKVGDYVFHPSGKQIKVLGISNKDYASLEVEFSNGEKIKVHPNHEWTVYDRSAPKWKTIETKEILSMKYYSGNRSRYQLPNIFPLENKEVELPLDPYFLGAWLGDGTSAKPAITSEFKDRGIIENIPYKISNLTVHKDTGVPTYYFGHQEIMKKIRELGCYKNKHIPEIYKRGSIQQRLQLLAGLIDTDGSRDKKSRYRIVTVSKKLAEDIAEIVTSLGMRPYIMEAKPILSTSGIQGTKITYSVGFQPTMEIPVALERKKVTRIAPQSMIGIVSIKECEPELGHCIQVDSEDGLYLVGKTLLPTHNSQLASIYFPAWALGKYPDLKFILSTYGAELSEDIGMKTRDTISAELYQAIFPGVTLKTDTKSKAKWMTNKGGSYTAVGVGGAITGKGANCIIIDDPHKDRAEAESELARKNVWDYYRSTLYSRLEGLGTIIVIMQRWRQDDLVGLLLEEDERIKKENPDSAENWEVIDFPAIAVDDEYDENGKLIRKEGEPLWKDKYPMEFLSLIRQQSPYFWASQYMQNPILAEVAEFKKEYFRYFNEEDLQGKYLRYYTICDPAISQKKSGDNTVVVTIAKEVNGPNFYRIREDAGKYTPQQTIDLIFQHQNEYHSEVAVETVQYQQALKFMIVEEQRKRGQFFIMHELKSSQKKEERIRGMLALYQNGLMHHRYGDLNYEEELLAFPNGRRDDRIDAAAYIIQIANNTFTGNGVKQFKQKWLGYGRKAR